MFTKIHSGETIMWGAMMLVLLASTPTLAGAATCDPGVLIESTAACHELRDSIGTYLPCVRTAAHAAILRNGGCTPRASADLQKYCLQRSMSDCARCQQDAPASSNECKCPCQSEPDTHDPNAVVEFKVSIDSLPPIRVEESSPTCTPSATPAPDAHPPLRIAWHVTINPLQLADSGYATSFTLPLEQEQVDLEWLVAGNSGLVDDANHPIGGKVEAGVDHGSRDSLELTLTLSNSNNRPFDGQTNVWLRNSTNQIWQLPILVRASYPRWFLPLVVSVFAGVFAFFSWPWHPTRRRLAQCQSKAETVRQTILTYHAWQGSLSPNDRALMEGLTARILDGVGHLEEFGDRIAALADPSADQMGVTTALDQALTPLREAVRVTEPAKQARSLLEVRRWLAAALASLDSADLRGDALRRRIEWALKQPNVRSARRAARRIDATLKADKKGTPLPGLVGRVGSRLTAWLSSLRQGPAPEALDSYSEQEIESQLEAAARGWELPLRGNRTRDVVVGIISALLAWQAFAHDHSVLVAAITGAGVSNIVSQGVFPTLLQFVGKLDPK